MNHPNLSIKRRLTKRILISVTLACLIALTHCSTLITHRTLSRGVHIERNLLVFTKIQLPYANYSISGLETEYVSMERERRLAITGNPEFREKLQNGIFKVMNGPNCSLKYGKHKFFARILTHRLKKSLEKDHLNSQKLKLALHKLGKAAHRKSQRMLNDDPNVLKKSFETDTKIQFLFGKVVDVIHEGIKNRLKEGIAKSVQYSEKRLRKIIVSHFKRLCIRDDLNEKGRNLGLASYFLKTQLANAQFTKPDSKPENDLKLTWLQHQTNLMKQVTSWTDTGALTTDEASALSRTTKQLLRKFLNQKLVRERKKYEFQHGIIGGSNFRSNIQNLREVASKLDNLKNVPSIDHTQFLKNVIKVSQTDDFLAQNDKLFVEFTKEYGNNQFKDLKSFFRFLRIYLKSMRIEQMSCASQSNKVINSARKLYLRDLIDKKKFNYRLLKKGILLDLKSRQNESLHWKFFMNIIRQNLSEYGSFLDGLHQPHKNQSGWKKKVFQTKKDRALSPKLKKKAIKDFFNHLDRDMTRSVSSHILPNKFVEVNLKRFKTQTTNEIRISLGNMKDLDAIQKVRIGHIMNETGRILRGVQLQARSYKHILLTNMLNKQKSYNPRFLKRCKRLFTRTRSSSVFTKEAFYVLLVKMFFESHTNMKIGSPLNIRKDLTDYLQTLEFFKMISPHETDDIVNHILSLILHFMKQGDGTFDLDKFFAFYSMVLTKKDELNFETGEGLEDWPTTFVQSAQSMVTNRASLSKFLELQKMLKAYKDHTIELKGKTNFLVKMGIHTHKELKSFIQKEYKENLIRIRDLPRPMKSAQTLLLKALILMFAETKQVKRQSILTKLTRFKDHFKEVKIPDKPKLRFLIKSMLQLYKLSQIAFKSHQTAQIFGFKMLDHLIDTQPAEINVSLHQLQLPQRIVSKYVAYKMQNLFSVAKDMHLDVHSATFQAYIAGLLHLIKSASLYKSNQAQVHYQQLVDNLNIPDTPYSQFILKQILSLGNASQLFSNKQLSQQSMAKVFKDTMIEVTPGVVKFLVQQKLITKADISAYMNSQIRLMAQKYKDYKVNVLKRTYFLLKSLFRAAAEAKVTNQQQLSLIAQKVLDRFIFVKPAVESFLIKTILRFKNEIITSIKSSSSMKLTEQKVMDYLVHVKNETDFLLTSILNLTAHAEVTSRAQLKTTLTKVRDMQINVFPGVAKFLMTAILKIAGAQLLLKNHTKLKFVSQKFVDRFVKITPGVSKFFLKNLISQKSSIQSIVRNQLGIFFQKIKDQHVEIKKEDVFLIKSLQNLLSKFQTSAHSLSKLSLFFSKFKDQFVQPQGPVKFLLKALLNITANSLKIQESVKFKPVFQVLQDQLVRVQPGVAKFLLRAEQSLVSKAEFNKMQSFSMFWIRFKDFFVSPQSFDQFMLSQVMFEPGQVSFELLKKMKLQASVIRDYFNLVKPGMQKFLLTSFFHFMAGTQFYNKSKLRIYLKSLCDNLIIPKPEKAFLLTAFMGLAEEYTAKSNLLLTFQAQKFKDNFISVDIPNKFLVSSLFTEYQKKEFQKLMKLRLSWQKLRDFLVSPFTKRNFLIFNLLFLNSKSKTSVLTTQQAKIMLQAARDFHVLVQPGMPKFILKNLQQVLLGFEFYDHEKLNFTLKKFVDNFIMVKPEKMFLVNSLLSILQPIIVKTTTGLKINSQKLYDYYINVEVPGKFLMKNEQNALGKVMKKQTEDLRLWYTKMRDFLISPMGPQQFVIWNLLFSKSINSIENMTNMNLINQKLRDFHNLVQPGAMKFLLTAFYTVFQRFSFSSIQKYKFLLQKFVDTLVLTRPERLFLIKTFLSISAHVFASKQHFTIKTMFKQLMDQFIPIKGHNFMIKAELNFKQGLVSLEALNHFKAKWEKYRDFFITPLTFKQFLIMNLMFIPSRLSIQQLNKMQVYQQAMHDFHVLVQPGFGKFLMSNLMEVFADIKFHSIYKLKFFLSRFLDMLIIPESQKSFLITAFLALIQPQFAINQKLNLKSIFSHFIDEQVHPEVTGKFLVKNQVVVSQKALLQRIHNFKIFWQHFQDFLIVPEALNKFILTAIIFTGQNATAAERQQTLLNFGIRMRDFHVLVQPVLQKFMISNLFNVLTNLTFYNKSKLRLFMSKFVDGLVLPQMERDFLIKALYNFAATNFVAKTKIDIHTSFKRLIDAFIEPERQNLFLINSESNIYSPVQMEQFNQTKIQLQKMKDFFISPLTSKQFVIMSLLFNDKDVSMKKAMALKSFSTKLKDFLNLPDLSGRLFLIKTFIATFNDIRASSVDKLHIMLKKMMDAFILTKDERKFMINCFIGILTDSFQAYQKFNFSTQFTKMVDNFVAVASENKFLIKSQLMTPSIVNVKKLTHFKTFSQAVRDYLIIPIDFNWMLYSLVVFNAGDPTVVKQELMKSNLQVVKDNHILIDKSFMMFLIKAVIDITQGVSFANESKLKFCLSHIIDSFIQVDSVAKFLIKYLIQIADLNFSVEKKIDLKTFFQKISDNKIDIAGHNFLIQSTLIQALDDQYSTKIHELKVFFQKFQDFLITPERLDTFLINSLLSLNIPDISFLKSLDLKEYLHILQDFHNLIDPSLMSFLMFALIETSSNLVFHTKSDLRVYLQKFMDYFVEADLLGGRQPPFLINALMSFFSQNCSITHDSLSFMGEKYLDRYIQIQPENKFLLTFLTDSRLQKSMKQTLRVKFLYEKLKDEHIEIENQMKFYISSFLETRGISSTTFMRDLKVFNQNSMDYLVEIQARNFLIKSLLVGDPTVSTHQNSKLKLYYQKFKDELNIPSPVLAIFLLKTLISFFGDIKFESKIDLHFFFKKFMDYFYDVIIKNTSSEMLKLLESGIDLVDHRMNFKPLINKIHLFWLKKPVRDINLQNERKIYTKFLQLVHSNFKANLTNQKLFFLKKAVRDVNLINILQVHQKLTVETQESFIASMHNLRVKYIKKPVGWGMRTTISLKEPTANYQNLNIEKVFGASRIIPYVKSEHNKIESENMEMNILNVSSAEENVLFQRSRLKAFTLGESAGQKENPAHSHLALEEIQGPDDLSKTMVKELTINTLRKFNTEEDKYQIMYRDRHRLEDDMEKLELKAMQFNTLRRETARTKHLQALATDIKSMRDNLEKTVFKALEWEDRPEAPEFSHFGSNQKAMLTSIQKVNNRLEKVSKTLLKEAFLPIRNVDVLKLGAKLRAEEGFKKLKSAHSPKAFSKMLFKIVDESPAVKPVEIEKLAAKGLTKEIPKWLLSKGLKSPESFLKVILLAGTSGGNKKKDAEVLKLSNKATSHMDLTQDLLAEGRKEGTAKVVFLEGTKGGNKKSDKPTLTIYAKLLSLVIDAVKERNGARLDETGKVVLFAPTKGGNKKTAKETILKKLISELKAHTITNRGEEFKPQELAKIILKFVDHAPFGPKRLSAVLNRAEKMFSQAVKANNAEEMAKILLTPDTRPGNKKLTPETINFNVKAEKTVEKEIKKMKLVIEAAKKVLLKTDPWCCCCCEYVVTECCQETKEESEWGGEEEYEAWGEEEMEYVKQAEQQMKTEGINPETHADEFEELVQRLEDADDFECASGPDNLVYNILPEVSFKLGLKTHQEFDQELTETRDITKIVGDEPMYRIDGDFAQKMAENDYQIDPHQIRPRRPNVYFQEPEYVRAERMNDFLEQQINEEPGVQIGRVKQPFEVMDDFKGKDFHNEHHQTRNWREAQYRLIGDEGMDHFYERMLKISQSKPKLDMGYGAEMSKAQVEQNLEETVDKL